MFNKLKFYGYYGEALMGAALKQTGRKVSAIGLKLSTQGLKLERKGDDLQMRGVRKMVFDVYHVFLENRE